MGNNRHSGGAPALMLLAALLAASIPWTLAQGQGDGGVEALAEELRQLREAVEESSRADRDLFLVSFWVGMGIASTAVAGTAWNAWQLRRHVNVIKKDMDERLRPLLGWTTDSNLMLPARDVGNGGVFRIRIINAGPVAARGIVCSIKVGMASDFEAGSTKRKQEHRGYLAPDKLIEVRVPITTKQMRKASQQDKFRAEILVEYRGLGEKAYKYSMSGDYDGKVALWRD